MKTWQKCLAIVMTVAMLFSMFAMTSFAAQLPATLDIEAEQTNSSPDVYKITVSLTTPNPVCTIDLRLYYPKDVFKLIGKTGTPDSNGSNTAYNKLGQFLDTNEYECEIDESMGINDTIIYGAGTGSFQFNRAPNTNQYGTLDTNAYGCILFNWTANLDALSYLYVAPEKTAMFTFYMQVLDTAADGQYEIGQFDGGKAWTIDYAVDGETGSMFTGEQSKAALTINNAVITVGGANGPTVETTRKQVKFAWNADGSAVQDAFTFRLISQINANDYTDLFNLQADSATKAANIQKVGFVAANAGTDATEVKAAIENGAAIDKATGAIDGITGWQGATTDYVSLVNGVATFGCCLAFESKPSSDIDCYAFMVYTDADGATQYVWCDAKATAKVNSSYDTYLGGWKTANPFSA